MNNKKLWANLIKIHDLPKKDACQLAGFLMMAYHNLLISAAHLGKENFSKLAKEPITTLTIFLMETFSKDGLSAMIKELNATMDELADKLGIDPEILKRSKETNDQC